MSGSTAGNIPRIGCYVLNRLWILNLSSPMWTSEIRTYWPSLTLRRTMIQLIKKYVSKSSRNWVYLTKHCIDPDQSLGKEIDYNIFSLTVYPRKSISSTKRFTTKKLKVGQTIRDIFWDIHMLYELGPDN